MNNGEYMPAVVQAVPGDGFSVYAYFSDGSVKLADISHLIATGTVFEPLLDENIFRGALTVMNHTIAWDIAGNRDESRCVDLDPIAVYETARSVQDPLTESA